MAEKLRVHTLARELNVPSKVIVEKCRAEGVTTVKNHMSTLSAGLHATILEWFTEGQHDGIVETATRVDLDSVRPKEPMAAPKKGKEVSSSEDGISDAELATATLVAEAPVAGEVAAEAQDAAIEGSLTVSDKLPTAPIAEVPDEPSEAAALGDVTPPPTD